ncbi:MAG: tRNA (guanosine(37)-N1)-methyltransferase TrmD [Fimbriimonas sp.]
MRIGFVTLFPGMIRASLGHSILARAQATGKVEFQTSNPRDFCYDRHRKVDDNPYGGEAGMLIRAEPTALAVSALKPIEGAAVILTAPTGKKFTQADAQALSQLNQVIFLCGHYEGFDHRVETQLATHVFSNGDFVLTNGELPALTMADAVVRLLPGVLGSAESLAADSHSDGLLSAPNYTRPEVWRGEEVPAVLRSGDHGAIRKWRREQSLLVTRERRPDLLAKAPLAKTDWKMLSSSLASDEPEPFCSEVQKTPEG